ncbi:hypothetical protein [Spirosoma sp. 209]|uniref:hypothetical protein n=1 Tax=Spirosoma sp. 209 TaxID=1955701 RepID=UPI00098D46B2|nr:hypothetical protein [Spirosoma sp. 209]
MNPNYFLLYAHNIPVRGKERAALYNLQAGHILCIPLVLTDLIEAMRTAPVETVRQQFAPTRPELFDAYLNFLLRNDLGFYTDEPTLFPPLSLQWDTPHHIQTAVLDLDFDQYDPVAVLDQLDGLQCRHVEYRLQTGRGTARQLEALMEANQGRGFRSVSLLIDYQTALGQPPQWVHRLYEACPKIEFMLVYNAPYAGKSRTHPAHIQFIQDDIRSASYRASATRRRHIVNVGYFTEAQQFNPYYNRRVCISQAGEIKNCLQHRRSFGSVLTDRIDAVVSRADFRELWLASPDRVAGLRDSELRYCLFMPHELVADPETGLFRFPANSPACQLLV